MHDLDRTAMETFEYDFESEGGKATSSTSPRLPNSLPNSWKSTASRNSSSFSGI